MNPGTRSLSWMAIALCLAVPPMFSGCSGSNGDDDDATDTPPGDDDDATSGTPTPSPTPCQDIDEDGSCSGVDCDDTDPGVNPGAVDLCDESGRDEDCSGLDACQEDNDLDGYTEAQGDCDDASRDKNPGATDICGDDIDQDCDELVDDGCPDSDDDGDGQSELAGDCDDTDPFTYFGAPERLDGKPNGCNAATERVVVLNPDRDTNIYGTGTAQKVGWALDGLTAPASLDPDGLLDVNGDTLADFVIGAPGYAGSSKGAAILFLGSQDWPVQTSADSAPVIMRGEQEAAKAGWSVAAAGDVNYDGMMDLVVGAPGFDVQRLNNAGHAYLILGRASGWDINGSTDLTRVAISTIPGTFQDINMGYAVAGTMPPANLDLDEFDDPIMTGPNDSLGNFGDSWIFTMPGDASFPLTASPTDVSKLSDDGDHRIGISAAYAGDTDGDGYGDMLTGGEYSTAKQGMVLWLPGSDRYRRGANFSSYEDADGQLLFGTVEGELAGASVGGNGDVNGDGTKDFIVADGATKDRNDALAYLFLGGSLFMKGTLPEGGTETSLKTAANVQLMPGPNDSCPCSVSIDGDMNNDGRSDIVVGVSGTTGPNGVAGRVYIILGRPELPSSLMLEQNADYILEGARAGEQLGFSVAWAGDINGDGYGDFLLGAPGADFNQSTLDSGRVYIIFGFARTVP